MSDIYIEIENLPIGWSLASIESFADVSMGQSPPSDTYNDEGIGLPFFQGKAEFTELHPVVRKWCNASNKIAEPNDILMSVRAPVGATNIANVKCCIGRGLSAIRYSHCNKFLFYFFRLIENKLDEKGTGTTFRAISGDVIKNAQIYLPPLPEQHRIVAKIEELFSSLDKGIESLKTAQQQLKVYRQAVLKWAFEGKLTNSKNEKSVLVEDVAKVIDPQPSHRTPPEVIGGIPYVSIKDCDYNTGKIDFHSARKVSQNVLNEHIDRYLLESGDFIIGKIGTIGQPIQIKVPQDYTLSANVVLIQPRSINKKYLFYYFQSSQIEKEFKKGQSATAQAAFGIQKVRALVLNIPAPIEQQRIVSEIESRLSVCDKIEESITHSLLQAEALHQSILKKAFEGKLMPQDPNDEPASVLLERIKAEREALRQAQGKNKAVKKVKDKKVKQLKEALS